jgi:hypothetical protein
VVADGVTLTAADVLPVFHKYVPPPEAVKVALAPAHIRPSLFVAPEVSVTEMDADGSGCTVIVVVAVAVQLFVFVTVTV